MILGSLKSTQGKRIYSKYCVERTGPPNRVTKFNLFLISYSKIIESEGQNLTQKLKWSEKTVLKEKLYDIDLGNNFLDR